MEACQKFCAPVMVKETTTTTTTATTTTPATATPTATTTQSVCSLPAKKGSCSDLLLRYHYHSEKEDCVEFTFSGCGVGTFSRGWI